MSDLSAYYLNSRSSIVALDLLVLFHPNFSKIYRLVRNAIGGVTVTYEDTSVHAHVYYPMSFEPSETRENLDVGFSVHFGDLGLIIPMELDLLKLADNLIVKPTVAYRQYRSDTLTAPMNGPWKFEVRNIARKGEGAVLELAAPKMNINATGEVYTPIRFPMLYGALN